MSGRVYVVRYRVWDQEFTHMADFSTREQAESLAHEMMAQGCLRAWVEARS